MKKLKYKTSDLPNMPTDHFILPALTAGIKNQGLNNFVPKANATTLKNVISISANGANTGASFYQNKEFTVLQDAYAIKWKKTNIDLSENHYLFLTSAISKSIYGNYEWTNKAGWEKIKSNTIKLPIKKGEVDFEFMDKYISTIKSKHLNILQDYLITSGFNSTDLTKDEQKVLTEFENIEFAEFNITNAFDIKNTKNILSKDIIKNSGNIPYLCASSENNGVNSYINYDSRFLEKGNCIFIAGKTFVVSYQANDFYSNDSHNLVLYLKKEQYRNRLTQLFLTTCIDKSLSYMYSWGNSISNQKIKNDKISLPIKDKKINYEIMSLFISAIQKLVIKNIIQYIDNKIQ